ncbi:DUF6470 family protein [Pontibacillus marinus]|uniref:Uncharacterized protein n=1 Tax=Pontibacillus marinus BH030004 = DSM 16465 TaxID=1385511 RepID=A0A0A5G115_9BACI|nr:DUF6470 family protein [Pontibacillus marinus]KGX86796.1 hypothetical protein N783_11540 [Pontibacillus marinus BH030004 = DSM 16465]
MDFPQIRLNTQQAKTGLNIQNAKLTMNQQKADVRIEQPQADVSIKQHSPKLTIDQSNAWSNLGLKNVFERTRDTAQHANQKFLENLAKMSQEGDELMRIENGGNPIASQAKRNAGWDFTYKPGGMPVYDLVSLSYEPGRADINVKQNDPIIQTTPRKPQFQYQRGDVSTQVKQYSNVDVDFVGLKYVGTQGFEISI